VTLPFREWTRGDYVVSTDRDRLDLDVIHGFLSRSYWAHDRSVERIRHSIERSVPFGLYHEGTQVGFARVLTDEVVFAYLADVFVIEPHRGLGLGVWLVEVVLNHPDFARIRRWMLGTRDAHELYRKFGFVDLVPGRFMERVDLDSES
jgi:GNAT superfamily N-acetyltransferase